MDGLISRSETIKTIWKVWNEEINNSANFSHEETKAVTRAFQKLQKAIENQPIAYDVDAVVKELYKAVDSYCSDYHGVDYIEPEKAVDIARKGGV